MPRKLKKIEIFSLADFKKADRIERIRMAMVQPEMFELDYKDQYYADQLHQAYQIVFRETRQSVAMRQIQTSIPGCESWHMANVVYRDVQALYAPLVARNKDVLKAVILEKRLRMAEKAEAKAISMQKDADGNDVEVIDQEWMVIADKIFADIVKMEGFDKNEAPTLNIEDFTIPKPIISSNPEIFKRAQQLELEDGE